MSKNENRLNFRMTDETAAKIERWYQEDNCRSKNEFIEKAVNCYADMLAAGESTTLPRAVQSAIDSRLKLFEDRIASLLYKQAVEMDMAKHPCENWCCRLRCWLCCGNTAGRWIPAGCFRPQ